ncbi:ornithinee aminotransferase [uncultured Rothia sp.]|uniref:ornithinee aminotransferase n=1 Tax=uncultured Rothia sp. TaxID=316088 RepID=UPI0028D1CB42|nr:ornithinee aminotransferase [uncultured Rothia sp.]
MSFFGIGKKKWDEQAREAESTAAQDGHEESKPSRGSGLSDKIMEQQQWEDSLRRFVKSEGTRQNRDEERSEEYRAVEDLKRALLHDDEETPSFTEGSLSDAGKTTDEEERRSILEALNSYPHEDSEAAAAPEAREESNDSEAVEDAPAAPETPAFLRDDEDETSEKAEGDSSAKAEPSTDTAEDARSQFEEHLRAVRAESSAEESPATSDVDDTDRNAAAEEYLSAEQIREARTRAAIIEAKNAGLDDLAAVYAARLGLNPENEEDSFEEVEQAEDSEAVAAKQPAAEHSASERSTEPESLSAEPTRSGEKTEPAAEVLASETVTVEELSKPASEPAEPSSESEEKSEVAKDEAKNDAEGPASGPGSDEAASGEQKLSADDAELVAESIVLTAPAEGAADLPVLGEQRALHSLTELMRTRGSGTLSLELRQVDEDMHYRLLHRGREVENGIVLPGVDWFAPVAALYTEAQEAGATWNRAAVTLNPRLGEGLEVHASYLGAVDGQTTHESFLLETPAREETSVVATAEAAEAAEAHQAEAPEAEAAEAEVSESGDSPKVELETPAAEAQPSEEVREEQAPEQVERQSAPAGLAVAGAALTGAAALAASASESGEASVAEPEYEHDYDNDPIFGTANSQDAEATSAQPGQPEVSEADEDTEPVHAQPDAAEAEDAEAEAVDHGEEMEAALAAIVANAQEKLDEPQEPEETSTEAAAFVSVEEPAAPVEAPAAEASGAEAFNAESSAAESSAHEAPAEKGEKTAEEVASTEAEPELPTFLNDRELVPADEAEEPSKTAKAEEPEPAQVRSEEPAKAEAPAPAVTGALAAAAAVAAGGAAASAAPVASSAASSAVPSAPSTPVLSELNELPTVADEPDTPASQPVSPLVPSETQLAEGNLVLTEAQVAQRLAPVVEHLFGENGTAKDATTVLIRVRALGSYYDALTHVRRNGFWEQVRTFELIPETLLDIPALKTDSYSEGEGSPLAMSLTFTPGVPVQAAFDYANEQAFVSYPRPLDAERYVEELRMFPRLGSKIPAHMTSALSHWNL